jgi:hypothetical protein
MPSNIVQTELQNLLNGWMGIAAYTPAVGPMKLSLHTTTSSSTAAGTEVTGGAGPYARQTIAFTAPTAATPSVTANSGAVTFAGMPACTVTDVNIYDSTGTPVRRAFGALAASKVVNAGDTLSFAISAVSVSLGN